MVLSNKDLQQAIKLTGLRKSIVKARSDMLSFLYAIKEELPTPSCFDPEHLKLSYSREDKPDVSVVFMDRYKVVAGEEVLRSIDPAFYDEDTSAELVRVLKEALAA